MKPEIQRSTVKLYNKSSIMEQYYTTKGLNRKGPFTSEELKKQKISPNTRIWKEGLTDWILASELPELQNIIKVSPPRRVKKLDYFIKESQKEKINYWAIGFCCALVYLLCSFIIFDGYKALSMKSNIEASALRVNKDIFIQRDLKEEFDEEIFVYQTPPYGSSIRNDEESLIDVLPTLDAVIFNAFLGFFTIAITGWTFILGMGLNTLNAIIKYLQQYIELFN